MSKASGYLPQFYYFFFLLCTQQQSCDRSHLWWPDIASPAAAKSETVSVSICSDVIDCNYAPLSLHKCDEEWRKKKRKERPNIFDSSMRAIHDVSSGTLHTGVMKAFLRGSIAANWPSWINRGGGAERIHQTSPHLCEMSKEHHGGLLHLSGLKCSVGIQLHLGPSFRLFISVLSSFYPLILPTTPTPSSHTLHSKSLPRDLPSSLSPSQSPDSLPCQWINRRLSVTGGTACPDCTPTSW